MGYSAGIALATLLTACAVSTRIGTDLLETLSSMFNPLPAIALLPLVFFWFGLGNLSLMFVMVHSAWPVINTPGSGWSRTPHAWWAKLRPDWRPVHREDSHSSGFPSILTRLKIGWACWAP
jgi:NitT/TauT family transport system permease protein